MKRVICASVVSALLFVACNKKEPQPSERTATGAPEVRTVVCGKEIVADKPVQAGETGVMLPAGTKICISSDQLEVRVELPAGFAFLSTDQSVSEKLLPIYATYTCACSAAGSACNVFYAEGMGFGCLQSSCAGSCTGKFTYKGYEINRVINLADKSGFFADPAVQSEIRRITVNVSPLEAYGKFSVMGISFFLVQNEKTFLAKASCDCEGTQACKLKTISLPLLKGETETKKIYFCEGGCNGCELTIS